MGKVTLSLRNLAKEHAALRKLLRDKDHPVWTRLLKQIGVLLVSDAQKAFREQRLGTEEWPERYPNQKDLPKVNVAGIVSDLTRGSRPPTRRFQERPVGRDTNAMYRDLRADGSVSVDGFDLTVASSLPYSQRFQEGGKAEQAISGIVKKNLATLLKRKPELRDRLGWLFKRSVLETTSPPRPFLGVTEESRRRILRLVDELLSEATWQKEVRPRSEKSPGPSSRPRRT